MMRNIVLIIASLVTMSAAFGQQSVTDIYLNFIEKNPIENSYLHLTDELLFTGDSVEISGLITNFLMRPSSGISQVLKVSLVNEQRQIILTSYFKNTDGSFSGNLYLPHTLVSGAYFLVAHTAYMENFNLPLQDIKPVYIKNLWDEFQLSTNYSLPLSQTTSLKYYPEIGKLLPGINQRIVIEAPSITTEDNHQAVILKDGIETVRVELVDNFASTYFNPIEKANYILQIVNKENRVLSKVELKIEDDFGIRSSKIGANLIISVTKPSGLNESDYTLIIESGQQLQSVIDIKFTTSNTTTFVVPVKSLNGNFHSLVLINENKTVLASNSLYLKSKSTINVNTADSVLVDTQNDVIINGEDEVNLAISISEKSQAYLEKKLAAVYTSAPISVLLSPSYRNLSVADFIITQLGSIDKKWKLIFDQSIGSSDFNIRPELGIDIRGEVLGHDSKKLLLNFYQAESEISYQVSVKKDGSFYLPLFDFSGQETFIYNISDSIGNVYNHEITFHEDSIQIGSFSLIQQLGDSSIVEKMTLKRISAQYLIDSQVASQNLYDNLSYDKIYLMDDFVILPTFEEVIQDILVLATVKKIKGIKTIRLDVPSLEDSYNAQPTIIVEDRMVNLEDIWQLPPLYIHEIKLIHDPSKLEIYGGVGVLGGIIALKLKKNTPQTVLSKLSDKKIQLNGFTPESTQSFPNGYPNFSSTFVNTSLPRKYDHRIKYRSSNLTGQFILHIEGISETGDLIQYSKTIQNSLK